jgi:hypothetical protein
MRCCIIVLACVEHAALMRVGAWVAVRNARVLMADAHMSLGVDRWGSIESIHQQDAPSEEVNMQLERNLSLPAYEFVQVPA